MHYGKERQERLWALEVRVTVRLDPTENEHASRYPYNYTEAVTVYVDGSRAYAQRVAGSLVNGATVKQRYVEGNGD